MITGLVIILSLVYFIFFTGEILAAPSRIPVSTYPSDGNRRLNAQNLQVVSANGNDYSASCLCGGEVPCPLPPLIPGNPQKQCAYRTGVSPFPVSAIPLVNANSSIFLQIYLSPVKLTEVEFVMYLRSCTAGTILKVSALSDDSTVPWPSTGLGNFTWNTRPTPQTTDFIELTTFTCPPNIALNRRATLRTNFAQVWNLVRNTGRSTVTIEISSSSPFEIALPYGYNATIDAQLFSAGYDTYSDGRLGFSFTCSFSPYYMEDFELTDPTKPLFPIGFAEHSTTKVGFTDIYAYNDFLRELQVKPQALSSSYTPPKPITTSVLVLNEDKTPANPSFFDADALNAYWLSNGPLPYYTPYGFCLSRFSDMSSSLCANNNLVQGYTSQGAFSNDGPLENGNFVVKNSFGEDIARIDASNLPVYISQLAGFVYPVDGMTIQTLDGVYGQGTFYMILFVFDMAESVDSVPSVRLNRYSDIIEVTLNVYPVNDPPVLDQTSLFYSIDANEQISYTPLITNSDNDGISELRLLVSPKLGVVEFELVNSTWIWTYTPFEFFNSVDNNNGDPDFFTFAAIDASDTPCLLPLPSYTLNLASPVDSCLSCGRCSSETATVTIDIQPVYVAPIVRNTTYSINQGSSGSVSIVIDELIVTLPVTGDEIESVHMPSTTRNGIITVVPASGSFVYTYELSNLTFFGQDIIYYNVTNNRQLTSLTAMITINVIKINQAPFIEASPSYTTLLKTPLVAQLPGTDIDNPPSELVFIVTSFPSNGMLLPFVNGTFVYTPNPDYFGLDTFLFQVRDVFGLASLESVASILVNYTSQPPIAGSLENDQAYQAVESSRLLQGFLPVDDIQYNSSQMRYSLVDGPIRDGATVSIDQNGGGVFFYDATYKYEVNPKSKRLKYIVRDDMFSYNVTNPANLWAVGEINIKVVPLAGVWDCATGKYHPDKYLLCSTFPENPSDQCPENHIDGRQVCDGYPDCPNLSDEDFEGCTSQYVQSNRFVTAIVSLSVIVSIIFIVLTIYYRKQTVIKFASPMFLIGICIGCIIGSISVLYIWVIPDKGNCLIRMWLPNIAFVLLFGNLLMKTYRIYVLFHSAELGKFVAIRNKEVLAMVLSLVAIEAFILIIWTFVEPLEPAFRIHPGWKTARNTRPFYQERCYSESTSIYIGVLLAEKFCMLIAGCWLATKTRHVDKRFRETKYILLIMYTWLACAAIVLPVLLSNSLGYGGISKVVFQSFATLLVINVTQLILFIPKFLSIWGVWNFGLTGDEEEDFVLGNVPMQKEPTANNLGRSNYKN